MYLKYPKCVAVRSHVTSVFLFLQAATYTVSSHLKTEKLYICLFVQSANHVAAHKHQNGTKNVISVILTVVWFFCASQTGSS